MHFIIRVYCHIILLAGLSEVGSKKLGSWKRENQWKANSMGESPKVGKRLFLIPRSNVSPENFLGKPRKFQEKWQNWTLVKEIPF